MKKFKRAFTIAEVVVCMAMILIISLAAYAACAAAFQVIQKSNNTASIITKSQSLVQCFSTSLQEDDVLYAFKIRASFCFDNSFTLEESGDINSVNGITYAITFNCGKVDFNIKNEQSKYVVSLVSFEKSAQSPVYNLTRSFYVA